MAWHFINLVFYAAFNKQAHKCSVSESFNYGVTGEENNIREPVYGRFSAHNNCFCLKALQFDLYTKLCQRL